MPVPLVRINPLEYPQNALVNFAPLNNALMGIRRGQEFDATLGEQRYQHDQTNQLNQDRLGLDRERLNLARDTANRTTANTEEDRRNTILGNVAATIDGLEGDARAQAWQRLVQGLPNAATALQRYGIDPSDHVNGPRFLIAQTRSPDEVAAQRARTRYMEFLARGGGQGQGDTNELNRGGNGYRINEQGELERNAPEGGMFQPTGFRVPPNLQQFEQNVPSGGGLVTPAQNTGTPPPSGGISLQGLPDVPGSTVINRGVTPGSEQAQLLERIRSRQEMSAAEINQAWTAIYRRQPSAGYIFNRSGVEISNREGQGGRGATRTGQAAAGSMDALQQTISDAREALNSTNWIGRQASHITGIGTLARVMPELELGAAAIMHGLSGAQVNIPETNRYLAAFTPAMGDSLNTINRKLSHMELLITFIRRAQTGEAVGDADILALRNDMRQRLGQPRLTMEQHLGRGGRATPPPRDNAAPQPRPNAIGGQGSGNGWRIERIP